ncbi:PLP-dependent aminotransferase family protein [Asanoa sp. NPDC049573]|uniref:aminotransferase-like domain-containing protein n=1 Tax=Asanoa sp. NPDC049573 TaxID=3155396 RepID=UPI0034445374
MAGTSIEQLLEGWVHLDGPNLAARLALALRQLVESGLLPPGEQLPSERLLAHALHVSRPTVSAALDQLREAGVVVSRQGSGTKVATHPERSRTEAQPAPFTSAVLGANVVNLAAAVPFDASHLPGLSLSPTDLLSAVPDHGVVPFGLDAFREAAAVRLSQVGLRSRLDQIIVTAGGHHALRVAFETLAAPTAPVLVEEYTYGAVFDLAARNGTALIGIERDADGVDPQRLDVALRRTRPAFVLLATSIHSPSGQTTSPGRLRDLAAVLNAHLVPVVVDETYAELHYETRPTPLASMLHGPSITVESVSKTGWAGLRTGWIRFSEELRPRLLGAFDRDLGLPVPSQLMALRVLAAYATLLPARRNDLARKARLLREQLAEQVPYWNVVMPHGGLTHWIDTGTADATTIVDNARRAGLLITSGDAFHHRRATSSHVRICHDRPEALIIAATAKLGGLCGFRAAKPEQRRLFSP